MEFSIRKLEVAASTNDEAKRAAEAGAPAGTVIWALRQEAGRGRQGRAWASPAGNLYSSTVLRPPGGVASFGFYSFVAALAVGDVAAAFLPAARVELKWPNDVLVGGKKLSGILLEAAGEGGLVVGIGINVAQTPENPLYPATSLKAEGAEGVQLEVVLERLLAALAHWAEVFEAEGFAPLRAAWLARAKRGPLRARLPQEEINGVFVDLDRQGGLVLALPDGSLRTILTGDVFF